MACKCSALHAVGILHAEDQESAVIIQLDVKNNIGRFVKTVQGLDLTLGGLLTVLQKSIDGDEIGLQGFVDDKLELSEQNGKKLYRFRGQADLQLNGLQSLVDSYEGFFSTKKGLERTKASHGNLPKIFFLALTSAYDAYLATLIKSFYYLRPDLLERLEGTLTPAEINKFGSQEKAIEFLVDQEINALTRENLTELISGLENRFCISLRADFPISAELAEVMERKNLYTFNAGILSEQYLNVCRTHDINIEGIKPGHTVEITQQYFCTAWGVIYEAGIKIGHLLWRRIIPQEAAKANAVLQDLIFSLIEEKQYLSARNLLIFASTALREYADENNRFVFLLNGALTEYLLNEKEKCRKMLDSEDWDSCADILKLAHCVLTEEFEDAANLMRKLGKDNRPSKGEYLRWPLFEVFRKREEFSSAFKDIFGELTLAESEVMPKPATAKA